MRIEIDTSEVRTLQINLTGVEPLLARHIRPAVKDTAHEVWKQMRNDMRNSAHFGPVNRAITSELIDNGFGAEIGPEKGRPGSLANIAYFMPSVHVYRGGPRFKYEVARVPRSAGGGTVRDPVEILDDVQDGFVQAVTDAAIEVFK